MCVWHAKLPPIKAPQVQGESLQIFKVKATADTLLPLLTARCNKQVVKRHKCNKYSGNRDAVVCCALAT